jgi:hypothetical protein
MTVERVPPFQPVTSKIHPYLDDVTATAVAISEDGRTVAGAGDVANSTHRIEILDVATGALGRPPITLPSTTPTVTSLAFTPDGHTFPRSLPSLGCSAATSNFTIWFVAPSAGVAGVTE